MENRNQDCLTAIVVLGKHLNYKDKINDELKQRVKAGAEILNELQVFQGRQCCLVMSGGVTGRTLSEAEVMRQYAADELNVDNKQIVLEPASISTIQNALLTKNLIFFSDSPIFQSFKKIKLIVITSSYHKKRTEIIFRSVFNAPQLEKSTRTLSSLVSVGVDIELLDDIQSKEINETKHIIDLPTTLAPIPVIFDEQLFSNKTVHFIRHCESQFNKAVRIPIANSLNPREDPKYIDCRLSEEGEKQAEAVANMLKNEKFDLLVVSPLTRALQTAKAIYEGRGIKSVVLSQVAEFRVHGSSCDFGRPISKVREEFPQFDFSHLPEQWSALFPRIETKGSYSYRRAWFEQWLMSRPETNIVVIGHGHYLTRFLKEKHLNNGEIHSFRFVTGPFMKAEKLVPMGNTNVIKKPFYHAKFYEDRSFRYFPGFTIVCNVLPDTIHYKILIELQNKIKALPYADCYAFLPPSSFHMTIMGLADSKITQNIAETYAQIGKELKSTFSTLLSSSDWTYFNLEYNKLTSGLNLIELVPVGSSVKALPSYVEAVAKVANKSKPTMASHITIAYLIHNIPAQYAEHHKQFSIDCHNFLKQNFTRIELGKPQLTMFNDMSEFRSITSSFGSSMLLTLNQTNNNNNAIGSVLSKFRVFDYPEFALEDNKITLPSDRTYSHMAVFYQNCLAYVIMYNKTTGLVHCVQILSTYHKFVWVENLTLKVLPEFTQVESYPFQSTLLFYSATTGNLAKYWISQENPNCFSSMNYTIPPNCIIMPFHVKSTNYCLYYDKSTGKAAILTVGDKSFAVSKQFQWSLGWTHFVPFVYKDHQFYLAYKADKGQVHLTQIKDNLGTKDAYVSKDWSTKIVHIYAFSVGSEPYFMVHFADNKISFIKLTTSAENFSFQTILVRENVDVQTKCTFVDLSLNKLV